MAYARIEPLLHPARQHLVAKHDLGGALHIVHIDPAAFTLQARELGQQQARQPGHALLVVPGVRLQTRFEQAQRHILCLAHGSNADDLFPKLAGRAFVG